MGWWTCAPPGVSPKMLLSRRGKEVAGASGQWLRGWWPMELWGSYAGPGLHVPGMALACAEDRYSFCGTKRRGGGRRGAAERVRTVRVNAGTTNDSFGRGARRRASPRNAMDGQCVHSTSITFSARLGRVIPRTGVLVGAPPCLRACRCRIRTTVPRLSSSSPVCRRRTPVASPARSSREGIRPWCSRGSTRRCPRRWPGCQARRDRGPDRPIARFLNLDTSDETVARARHSQPRRSAGLFWFCDWSN